MGLHQVWACRASWTWPGAQPCQMQVSFTVSPCNILQPAGGDSLQSGVLSALVHLPHCQIQPTCTFCMAGVAERCKPFRAAVASPGLTLWALRVRLHLVLGVQ